MVPCYYKQVAALHIRDVWMLMWAAAVPGSRRGCRRCWYAVTELVMISRRTKRTCAPSLSCWDPLSLFLPHMTYCSPRFPLPERWRLVFRAVSLATLFSYAWVRTDNAAPFPPLPSSAGALGCACLVLFICSGCDVIRHEGSGALN